MAIVKLLYLHRLCALYELEKIMLISVFERVISRISIMLFVAGLVFLGGCGEDDNPITDDDDHGDEIVHADADGFVLKVDGDQIYRQYQGEHEGELTVAVGDEIEVHVSFLDDHGDEFHPGEEEHEDDDHDHDSEESEVAYSLGLTGYDSAIIEIHLDEEDEEHGHSDEDHEDEDHEDSGLSFGVEGLSAGNTEIKLQLIHGDHADYTGALLIPVIVE